MGTYLLMPNLNQPNFHIAVGRLTKTNTTILQLRPVLPLLAQENHPF